MNLKNRYEGIAELLHAWARCGAGDLQFFSESENEQSEKPPEGLRALAIQFAELNTQYKTTLSHYEEIKIILESSNQDPDSVTNELKRFHEEDSRIYDSLQSITADLLANGDFEITLDSTSEVIDLRELFKN